VVSGYSRHDAHLFPRPSLFLQVRLRLRLRLRLGVRVS